ncbi:hypothetical protein Xvie_02519 [Xenorhabdus vietnamensis]|uniref:Uncharacterized protein n=1 Tax=Xenorhabdus vietnamensis TaxID=351656 RepID=A0A1Y2SDR2_9GAMM|nr:hypothetical protein Xvie_02519 [Xenorhabdus vietnamensis]
MNRKYNMLLFILNYGKNNLIKHYHMRILSILHNKLSCDERIKYHE